MCGFYIFLWLLLMQPKNFYPAHIFSEAKKFFTLQILLAKSKRLFFWPWQEILRKRKN